MNEPAPAIVSWTDHALVKAQLLGFTRTDVEEIVLRDHAKRARNTAPPTGFCDRDGCRSPTTIPPPTS